MIHEGFVCACEDYQRSACIDYGMFREYEGKRYCVLHYPSSDKAVEFNIAFANKMNKKDYVFRGVWFPSHSDFKGVLFDSDVSFRGAYFNGDVDFMSAIFDKPVRFLGAVFNGKANFNGARFNRVVNFRSAKFLSGVTFRYSTFLDAVLFSKNDGRNVSGTIASLDMQFAEIEKPERVSFHTLSLQPHWFVNVDSHKFKFVNVAWDYDLASELDILKSKNINSPNRLLAIAFRQLADNAEDNHRYYEASRFRYDSFETRRVEEFLGFVPWKLDWWYWLVSGYGESVSRAFLVFAVLIALFSFGYTRTGFDLSGKGSDQSSVNSKIKDSAGKPLRWWQAFIYSVNVSVLRSPDPKPLTLTASALVTLQTIIGPAQAALIALAVRRRFMR